MLCQRERVGGQAVRKANGPAGRLPNRASEIGALRRLGEFSRYDHPVVFINRDEPAIKSTVE